MPITIICHLKQYELPSSKWVHSLQFPQGWHQISKDKRTKLARTESVKVAIRAQKKLRHMVLILKAWLISWNLRAQQSFSLGLTELTSIENRTPPIGEPKATATPAALAAVMTSRIWPTRKSVHKCTVKRRAYGSHTNSDCEQIFWINQPRAIQYNTQHELKAPPCRRISRTR